MTVSLQGKVAVIFSTICLSHIIGNVRLSGENVELIVLIIFPCTINANSPHVWLVIILIHKEISSPVHTEYILNSA